MTRARDGWRGWDDYAAFYDRAYELFCRLEAAVSPLYPAVAILNESVHHGEHGDHGEKAHGGIR